MPMVWKNIQRPQLNIETPKNINATTHMAPRNMPHKTRRRKHKRNMERNTKIQQTHAKRSTGVLRKKRNKNIKKK